MTGQRNRLVQAIKNHLVTLGPSSPLVQTLLKAYGWPKGFKIKFTPTAIYLQKQAEEIRIPLNHYIEVPVVLECFETFFQSIEPQQVNEKQLLDFSTPGMHRFRRNGKDFHTCGLPEEDSMDAYTFWYRPRSGDIVWDAGAHAGISTFNLATAVGPEGKVFSFEPDAMNHSLLEKNIDYHRLDNVVPLKIALTGRSGEVLFQADGTMSSGVRDFLLYNGRGTTIKVPSLSLPDACAKLGCVPRFIKMDIEGAEVAVIEEALSFLKDNPIHFAIESYHPMPDGCLTYVRLDELFKSIGYQVESSDKFGQMFTWARPPS